MRRSLCLACLLLLAGIQLFPSSASAFKPTSLGNVQIPAGYRLSVVASGIPYASNLAFDSHGGLWVTSAANDFASEGWVWYVPRARATPQRVIGPLNSALGLTWLGHTLFVSSVSPSSGGEYVGQVTAYSGFDGRDFQSSRVVLDGIPVGLHRVDSLAVGPHNRLYLGVGSQTDREAPTARLSASVISFRPDGGAVRVEASGLRNPYGLAFVPDNSGLMVSDEGVDFTGDIPPEELNFFDVSDPPPDFGFPHCYDQGGSSCKGTTEPLARLDAHAAAGGVAVSEEFGRLGPNVFVAEYGSSPGFGTHPTGARIVRVLLGRGGSTARSTAKTFAGGFHHPDPLGLAISPSGALYVTLWDSGMVISIAPTTRPVSRALTLPGIAALSLFLAEWVGVIRLDEHATLGALAALASVSNQLDSMMRQSASQP